ncbi:MAG: small subunit ribosomal protein S20 [Myxococcota bacterium]|jgi:small subunit ribosomal protein S20
MADHKQAIKRHKQSLVRNLRNRHYRSMLKTAVKKLRTAINESAPAEDIETLYRTAESTLHRVAQKGVIKHNAANRSVGRLARAIKAGPVAEHNRKAKVVKTK